MKKISALIFAVIIAVTSLGLTAAASENEMELSIGEASADKKGEVSVPIYITKNTGANVIFFELNYDSDVLSFFPGDNKYTFGENFSDCVIELSDFAPGKELVLVEVSGMDDSIATGEFLTLVFKVGDEVEYGKYDISFNAKEFDIVSVSEKQLDVVGNSGALYVCSGHQYKNGCDATCSICGMTRTVSHSVSSEKYASLKKHADVCETCNATFNETAHIDEGGDNYCDDCGYFMLYGDVVEDSSVDAKDLTRLKKYLSDKAEYQVSAYADANGDGSVDAKDLTRLKKLLSGQFVPIPKDK